jgi:hypothetical protein
MRRYFHLLARLRIPPHTVGIDLAILLRRLIRAELAHPVGDDLGRVDEDVAFLRVEPRSAAVMSTDTRKSEVMDVLSVLVPIPDDCALPIDRHELDVTVSSLLHRIQRSNLLGKSRQPLPSDS